MEDGLQLSVEPSEFDIKNISSETIFKEYSRLVMRICLDTSIDPSEFSEYEDDMYKSGEIYSVSEIIQKLVKSSAASDNDITVVNENIPLRGVGITDNDFETDRKTEADKNHNIASFIIGGFLMTAGSILAIFLIKKRE